MPIININIMSENKKIIFVDGENHQTLLPLTFTRPAGDLRLGILTIAEKWALQLELPYCFNAEAYLQIKFPLDLSDDNLVFFECLLPNEVIINAVKSLQKGAGLFLNDKLVVARVSRSQCRSLFQGESGFLERVEVAMELKIVSRPFHLVADRKSVV